MSRAQKLTNTVLLSTDSYLPEIIIGNKELNQFPKNATEAIENKTGVKFRRFSPENMCTSDLAIKAAEKCLKKVNFNPKDIDSIILATSSPDRFQPATATRVQYAINAVNAFAFDVNSVCSGAVYSICIADALIKSQMCKNVLVIAAEMYSKFLNPLDFSTAPFFGDGAGAVLFGSDISSNKGIIKSILKTDGSGSEIIEIPGGGSILPFKKLKNTKDTFFKMDGRKVYSFAVEKGTEIINEIIEGCHLDRNEIKYIIPHQANINIIKEISIKVGIKLSKFHINLDRYGNTAAASILIGLDELISTNIVKDGDLLILVGFGGGLSWGANLIRI